MDDDKQKRYQRVLSYFKRFLPVRGIKVESTSVRLTSAGIDNAARALGVSPATIKTVIEVETNGSGFLPDGRPKILFERHIFYRQLKARGVDVITLSKQVPDLCQPTAGGYSGGTKEWDRFERAQRIHPTAAIEAASWGLGQVLGSNAVSIGYASPEAYMADMKTSEDKQLEAMVRFIKKSPALVGALIKQDWATFARLYNGPNYSVNKYDIKLAQAFKRQTGNIA